MTTRLKEISLIQQHSECLLDERGVDDMLDELAQKITRACGDKNPVILCVMTGAVIAVGLLLPRLKFLLELDYVHATRYRGKTTGGLLHWEKYPSMDIKGRTVVIIDDVLDEGETMSALIEYCEEQGVASCYSAVLVNKKLCKQKPLQADFVGLEVGDQYLYGLGMDYKGYLRNVKGVYACPANLQALLCQP